MTEPEIRRMVLELFEQCRQAAGADYEESRFMDYLIQPPAQKGRIKNTFKGTRKFFQYINVVELGFGICFSFADLDRSYSVDQFVGKVKERYGKPRGNKMLIRERIKEKDRYILEIVSSIILFIIVGYFRIHFVSGVAFIMTAFLIWWSLSHRYKDRKHNETLFKIIMGKESE